MFDRAVAEVVVNLGVLIGDPGLAPEGVRENMADASADPGTAFAVIWLILFGQFAFDIERGIGGECRRAFETSRQAVVDPAGIAADAADFGIDTQAFGPAQ